MKYQVWAIGKNGDGYIQDLGIYDDITELRIYIGNFADDVMIEIEETEDINE